ncbi:MAG: ATP-binding cassette domain-containing protein [Granulosicoccaceae bacterium]
MNALRVEQLTITLPNDVKLCDQLSFTIEPGRVLALMGPSGSGKSSILSWITGTLAKEIHASGELWLGGTSLVGVPTEKRRLGLMLQQDYLFPHMSVDQNLKFGLQSGDKVERERKITESLGNAGLASLQHANPATLSGGQRSRVSLLRSLLSEPCALLLDEPFARLDSQLRQQIREFTWAACKELPVLLVTHDKADIPAHADVLELADNHA